MAFPEVGVQAGGDVDDAAIITESLARPERFAVIFDRYFAEVHRYAERRVGTDAADEIASDTFLVAFGKRERYRVERRDARPWQRPERLVEERRQRRDVDVARDSEHEVRCRDGVREELRDVGVRDSLQARGAAER